jgi:hypothetical protein
MLIKMVGRNTPKAGEDAKDEAELEPFEKN